MSPRDIQPNLIHLVHRRVAKGNELLCKCPKTRAALTYALVEAAEWFGIELHSAAFLDGEYFLSLNDRHGLLPLFMQRFNHNAAMSLKAVHRVDGVFWEPGRSYDDTVLDNREDILRALAFVHSAQKSSPRQGRQYSGTYGWDFWDPIGTVERPDRYRGSAGTAVEAKLVVPDALTDDDPALLRQQIEALAREHHWPNRPTRKRRARRRRNHRRCRPRKPTFRLTAAAARRAQKIGHRFQHAYRKAWKQLQRGITSLFPKGTWWLAFHAIVDASTG